MTSGEKRNSPSPAKLAHAYPQAKKSGWYWKLKDFYLTMH
jgi:hypothetical protein